MKSRAGKIEGTASKRKFTYQSFSRRIAGIKIDPVLKVRRYVDDEESQKSFFRPSLDTWIDMNLSANFTQFIKETLPLSDSLPHILHYQLELMDLLAKYIELKDEHSLEPLLDLLVQFARDLGPLFEPHFDRTVQLLTNIVVQHNDASVIEWSFNCLAYLLKHFSRLLLPDLGPLYNILSPLLGKEKQKSFVARFAAEALSFLFRKAKDENLERIVSYAISDLQNQPSSQYEDGLASTLVESCVSVEKNVHSRCPSIVKTILNAAKALASVSDPCLRLIQKVITGVIHRTEAKSFCDVLEVILQFTDDSLTSRTALLVGGKSIYTAVTVRKGSRILYWERMADLVSRLLDAARRFDNVEEITNHGIWEVVKAGAVILQFSDMSVVISSGIRIIDQVREYQGGQLFLPFCELLARLDSERFQNLSLIYLQRFVTMQWLQYEAELLLLLPKLIQRGCIQNSVNKYRDGRSGSLIIDLSWLDWISRSLNNFREEVIGARDAVIVNESISSDTFIRAWHHCVLLSLLQQPLPQQLLVALKSLARALLEQNSLRKLKVENIALVGKCLAALAKQGIMLGDDIWDCLYRNIPGAGEVPAFLQGVVDCMNSALGLLAGTFSSVPQETLNKATEALVANLRSPEKRIRELSIECFEMIVQARTGKPSEAAKLAKAIEGTPFTLTSARTISLYIRQLGSQYVSINQSAWDFKLIPNYLFGLLSIGFAPAWEDAIHALAKVAAINEEVVARLAFEWLQETSVGEAEQKGNDIKADTVVTALECSNLRAVDEISSQCLSNSTDALANLHTVFKESLRWQKLSAAVARTQALRVLCELPHLAAKRSKSLVPLLLEWSRRDNFSDGEEDEKDEKSGEEAETLISKWARNDQLSMLTLFSRFTNPRVLYKMEIVYDTFLDLLKSGDTKVQSLAFKCILTWNTPAISTYKINLDNLMDETRFRDEITNFIQPDESESLIQPNHRAELMPVLLRILYGRALSRRNANSGKGMESRRTAILSSLANFLPSEREMFIDIAVGELSGLSFVGKTCSSMYEFRLQDLGHTHLSARKQAGFLRMTEDMLKQLGASMLPWVAKIIDPLLYCLVYSLWEMKRMSEDDDSSHTAKTWKPVRQAGFKSLNALFISCPTFPWRPYMTPIFKHIITPRLALLPIETSQQPSNILQIISTWSTSSHTITFLVDYNPTVVQKIAETIGAVATKDEVVIFALKIISNIVGMADPGIGNSTLADIVNRDLLQPNLSYLLKNITALLQRSPGREILETGIFTVSRLAPFVDGGFETTQIIEILVFLLEQPSRRVSPRAKSDVLRILQHFLPHCPMRKGDHLAERALRSVSSLFVYFRDRESRGNLAAVLRVFAAADETLHEIAELCVKLNSFSKKRLDEPDYDQRLEAYAFINETAYQKFTARQWTPLIYNMLYYVKDPDLSIREVSSLSLRRFAEICGNNPSMESNDCLALLTSVVLPAIKSGAREQSELIRNQYVLLMGHIVKHCQLLEEVADMKPLLVGEDEEANFFNNILYVQQHRRSRALRRLATTVENAGLSSSNIAHFFLPLIEHFVIDPDRGDAHQLTAEAITTIGVLAESLTWSQFKALFRRYMAYITSKQDNLKTIIRLIGAMVDSLTRAHSTAQSSKPTNTLVAKHNGDISTKLPPMGPLAQALPNQEILVDEISTTFLPAFTEYLHEKDESAVSLRVPVGVSIVKLLKLFPDQKLRVCLPSILTDICHILRSRAQESRDIARKTLADITSILGSDYFAFVLKELRGALVKGYQLHVLSYTVHYILVTAAPEFAPGALDYCATQVVDVIIDDIFGVTGQEKEAEEYTSKMKEVKSSKSYDSMELLAQITTISRLGELVRPIQALLQECLTQKLVKKVNELLRRITLGLLKNEAAKTHESLVFCYQVIQNGYRTVHDKAEQKKTISRYLVNLQNPHRIGKEQKTTSRLYVLTRFALDILRAILGKHEELMTPENVAGFIPIVGDAVLSPHEEVKISALRLLTTIIRLPLSAIDEGVPVFIKRCISFIRMCPSTNHELAQASLKLVAAIIRERKNTSVKESAIAYILTRLKSDLEEPDRQGIAFGFVKAVMSRKIIATELYEIMDDVATILVTSQDKNVRALARGTYYQFLMEYPHGKERLNKQYAFLIKNLDYAHQSGRESVMEVMNSLLTKIGDELIQDVIGAFLVPLVLILINDESPECREMAGALLRKSLERADNKRGQLCTELARKWLSQEHGQPLLVRVALQLYTMYIEVNGKKAKKEVDFLRERILEFLQNASPTNTSYEREAEAEADWQILYFSLRLWAVILRSFPELSLSRADENVAIWNVIQTNCLSYPHSWIRLSSARLVGLYFASWSTSDSLVNLPLKNQYGLELQEEDMMNIVRRCAGQLSRPLKLTEELGLQIVKILLFLGRCFYANRMIMLSNESHNQAEDAMLIDEQGPNEQWAQFSVAGTQAAPEIRSTDTSKANEASNAAQKSTTFSYLFHMASRILRQEPQNFLSSNAELNIRAAKAAAVLSKTLALQFLAAMVTQVVDKDIDTLSSLATPIIYALYTLVEVPPHTGAQNTITASDQNGSVKVELQELAQILLHHLSTTLGPTAYNAIYNMVRTDIIQRRIERKHKRSIAAIADPEVAARKKAKKNEKKKVKKKEKIEEWKRKRSGI